MFCLDEFKSLQANLLTSLCSLNDAQLRNSFFKLYYRHSLRMSRIQYVGRQSQHFFGKYLSEIVRNLKDRGRGRVLIKETEAANYSEPCFYVIDHAIPVMSDKASISHCSSALRDPLRQRLFNFPSQ